MVKWRHVQEQLGHKNLVALTNKYDKKHKKHRSELNESKNNQIENSFMLI